MTNTVPHGSGGAPPTSYPPLPGTGLIPRRSSYASVAAGTATVSSQNYSQPARPGAFSHLMNPAPMSTTYPPSNQIDHRPHRLSQHGSDMDSHPNGGRSLPGSWGRGGPLPSYSSQFMFSSSYGIGGIGASASNQFFVPSYLRNSRYVERLAAAHKAKHATHREGSSAHSSNGGSLSTSSSSVNLHRMTPSHRGMTYDIVEHPPPIEDDGLTPLPSKWAEADRFGGLEILGDGLEVRYKGPGKSHEHEAAAARADHPMPPQCGIYYYEVTMVSKGKEGYVTAVMVPSRLLTDDSMIGIGFSGSKANLERIPGWEPETWGYHGDDGKSHCCGTPKQYGPNYSTSDVIGCGVNFSAGSAFYTKNGVFLGSCYLRVLDYSCSQDSRQRFPRP